MHARQVEVLVVVLCPFPAKFRMALIAVLAVRALVGIDMAFRAVLSPQPGKVEQAFAVEGLGLKPLVSGYVAFAAFDVLMLALDRKPRQLVVIELAVIGEFFGVVAGYAGLVRQHLAKLIPMLIRVAALAELVRLAGELELPRPARRLAGQHVF